MRLAIITDIHEDLPSLEKTCRKADKLGYDIMVCLGDICGFSHTYYSYEKHRHATACLDLVRKKCRIIIPGNHDMNAAEMIPQHSAVFNFPPDWYKLSHEEQTRLSRQELWLHDDDEETGWDQESLEFIHSLPEYEILDTASGKIMFSHYAYPNLSGFSRSFYSREKEFKKHLEFMERHECTYGFTGHAHPRGFYTSTKHIYHHFLRKRVVLDRQSTVVGVPPVSRQMHRRGFCIFDTSTLLLHKKS